MAGLVLVLLALVPICQAADGKVIVQKVFDLFAAGDTPSFLALMAEDVVHNTTFDLAGPVCSGNTVGKAAFVDECLSRINIVHPGFAAHPEYIFKDTSGKNVFTKVKFTTDGGVDTYSLMHFTLNKAGKITSIFNAADSLVFAREAERAQPSPVKVVKNAYAFFASGEMEEFMALLDPKMMYRGTMVDSLPCGSGRGPYTSPEAWHKGCISHISDVWPGLKMTPVHFISEGAFVFVTAKAQNKAGMDTYFGHRWKVVGGKVVDMFAFDDSAALSSTANKKFDL
mmetsp:Transcript_80053/g.146337  ORF Transcript_80053/g.146337 Transcript_80053/m.146337 type:complete len:283 (-) Transcript_80053:326-1174(-)